MRGLVLRTFTVMPLLAKNVIVLPKLRSEEVEMRTGASSSEGGRRNHAQGADSRDSNALAVPAVAVEGVQAVISAEGSGR